MIRLADENSVEYIELKAEKSKVITDVEELGGLNSTYISTSSKKKSWYT